MKEKSERITVEMTSDWTKIEVDTKLCNVVVESIEEGKLCEFRIFEGGRMIYLRTDLNKCWNTRNLENPYRLKISLLYDIKEGQKIKSVTIKKGDIGLVKVLIGKSYFINSSNIPDNPNNEKKFILSESPIEPLKSLKSTSKVVDIILLTMNQLKYTKECIASLYKNTIIPFNNRFMPNLLVFV